MTRTPEPPENVRVKLRDGRVVPVECRHVGWRDGTHRWEAVCPIGLVDLPESGNPYEGVEVLCDVLPGRTSVGLHFVLAEVGK
jgi:hypothetical protein